LAFAAACGDNQDPEGAAVLWKRIHEENYRSWSTAPGYESPRPSNAPHSDRTQVFINPVVEDALQGPPVSRWPVDSLIVKDGYTDDGELELVALMHKRDDGWFWAEYDSEGDPDYSGRPDTCIDCHASAVADSVFTLAFPD
jgi:hypothetical protein